MLEKTYLLRNEIGNTRSQIQWEAMPLTSSSTREGWVKLQTRLPNSMSGRLPCPSEREREREIPPHTHLSSYLVTYQRKSCPWQDTPKCHWLKGSSSHNIFLLNSGITGWCTVSATLGPLGTIKSYEHNSHICG